MSAAQYTLNQGWKCSTYATAKPKSSECHIHKVTPLSKPTAWSKAFPVTRFSFIPSFPNQEEEIRGSEKTKRLYLGKKSSEGIQQPMTNGNQLLEQPETNPYPCISFHACNLSHASHNSPMLKPPGSKGCHPASQWAGMIRNTRNSKPSIMDRWINFPSNLGILCPVCFHTATSAHRSCLKQLVIVQSLSYHHSTSELILSKWEGRRLLLVNNSDKAIILGVLNGEIRTSGLCTNHISSILKSG